MDTKKFLIGSIVGGIAHFILGFVLYGILLEGFFAANAGTATGVSKGPEEMVWWALILGSIAFGALLSYIFLKWAHISTFKGGLRAGAAIGFLLAVSFDMIYYATANIMTLSGALVDVVVATVMTALVGGIIGAVLHVKPKEEPAMA